jgi:Flp pilus assembly CpaE family ATPase
VPGDGEGQPGPAEEVVETGLPAAVVGTIGIPEPDEVAEEADLVVSLLLPEIPSIKNSRILLDLFGKLDLPREKLLFVMNQVERRESISAERVSEHLGHPVAAELPFDLDSVKGAVNRGDPLVRDEKSGALYQPLLDLTGEVKERLLELEPQRQPAG